MQRLKPLACTSRALFSVSLVVAFFLLTSTQAAGQTTIWTEDFTGETISGTGNYPSITGDQWTAARTGGNGNKTPILSVGGGDLDFVGPTNGNNGNYICTWTSDPIDASGYTDLTVSYASVGQGTAAHSITGDASSTVITIVLTIQKFQERNLDDIILTGTLSCTPTTWYADADGDGLGNSGTTTSSCSQPDGYVADSTDQCDDLTACNYDASPSEECVYATTWYADDDGDGLGDAADTQSSCSQPSGYVADGSDLCDDSSACNYDANATTNAACQTLDECGVCGGSGIPAGDCDCDGNQTDVLGVCGGSCTADVDSDGVCDDVDLCTDTSACNYAANPTAACSSTAITWYEDADGDGLGDPAASQTACSQPTGYVSNNSDDNPLYTGTVLSPGDVYFSYAADDFGDLTSSYVGFTLLVDVVAGTKLVLTSTLAWNGTNWITNGFTESAYEWTAPSGGVSAGTEVILFDIYSYDDSSVGSSGIAKIDGEESPIKRSSAGNNLSLEGGQQCGTWTRLGSVSTAFTYFDAFFMWIFQPDKDWQISGADSPGNGSACRHLNCVGFNLDVEGYADVNTGSGTLIEGDAWGASMDPNFSYEASLFAFSSQWAYAGGGEAAPFALTNGELVSNTIAEATSFSASDGNTPNYQSTNAAENTGSENAAAYDALDFDPNGFITLQTSVGWNALASGPGAVLGNEITAGAPTLNIEVNNGIDLTVDVMDGVSCNNITVATGTFNACDGMGRELAVNGSITLGDASTFDGGQGTLSMASMATQVLDANNYGDPASTKVQLKNWEILNSRTTVSGHVRMKPGGAVTFGGTQPNDEIKLDDVNASSISFESSAAGGTAAIGPCEASNFADGTSQEFTFQRYIPADSDGSTWVNIGAYVTGTTVSDWTDANPSMLIFKYEESNYGSLGAGWSYLWDGTTVLTPGSGYMALIPQNQDALISVTGAFQIGDVDIDLTFTDDPNQSNSTVDGWNLVSNPYPSAVDLAQVISRVDGVEAFYIYDNTGDGGYTTVNENGVGGSDTLDVGQSFWVKVSANKTLTFQETDKVVGSNTFIRELPETFEGSIGVHIANEVANQWSKAFIQFDAEATIAFNENEDAVFYGDPSSGELNAWTVAETGQKLSIQSAGSAVTTPSLPLHVTSGAGGTVRISGITDGSTPSDICAVVEDLETGERAQLGLDVLEVNLPANTTYTDRFILHFTPEPSVTWESTVCNGLDITMSGEAWESWDASWSAEDGSASGTGMPYELEDGAYTFEFSLPEAGCVQSVDVTIETACLGDLNFNGERDIVDLLVLLSGLPTGALESEFAVEADCDCDGALTIEDMLTFLAIFGTDCD